MAQTKLMGQQFRVFEDAAKIDGAVSCQVTINQAMEDGSTKDTTGSFTEENVQSKNWQVQVDDKNGVYTALRALLTSIKSQSAKTVGFDRTSGANNGVAQNEDWAMSGQAYLSQLTITANNRQDIQVSRTYTGTGALS